ncbi:MAG: hypothetical protein AAFR61_03765 [Bacteroidota bacterium]
MKRIVFITACLAPGKDGLGDYSRVLAEACSKQGHAVGLVALHDPFCEEEQTESLVGLSCLRLPTAASWAQRVDRARSWVSEFGAEETFFQFVIYGYHPKGLPFQAMPHLMKLLKGLPGLSIMYHEPWIGRAKNEAFHHRVIGSLQRGMIRQMHRQALPYHAFTSNPAFQGLLQHHGMPTEVLPLPSNIPFRPEQAHLFPAWIQSQGVSLSSDTLSLGHFGRIPHQWQWENLLEHLPSLCLRTNKKKAAFIFAGRSDRESSRQLVREFQKKAPGIQVLHLGPQSPEMISSFLQYIDLGIATTSPQILGKSGAFAAYREHGLPVILAGEAENFRLPLPQHAVTDYPRCFSMDAIPGQLSSWIAYPLPQDTVQTVAQQFLQAYPPKESVYESSRH